MIPRCKRSHTIALAMGIFCALPIGGCSTSRVEVSRSTPVQLNDNEGIVILARRGDEIAPEPEDSFLNCLTETLGDGDTPLKLYPEQQFVDDLFPWFEPRTAPATPEDLSQLLQRPAVSRKVSVMGVRYVVWVQGDTETVDKGGALSCAVGPGGGGCFGFVWWDNDSSYEVSIWDLEQSKSVGAVSAEVLGTSYIPALVLPIPLIARTQNTACQGLAEQLGELLHAESSE